MKPPEIDRRPIDNNDVDFDQLKLLEPVQEKYKLNRYFYLLGYLYFAVSLPFLGIFLAKVFSDVSFIAAMTMLFLFSMLPSFLLAGWAIHTYLYKHSEQILSLFSFLCDNDEHLISFSTGKPSSYGQFDGERLYFLFSTKRIFVIRFVSSVKYAGHIEDAVIDETIIDKIEDIYICGYGKNDSKYGGRFSNVQDHLFYTRLIAIDHRILQQEEYLLEHKFSKNGQLIRKIFDAAKNKSAGVKKSF